MPEIPEFHNDEEMVAWFEQADLSEYNLVEALEVVVSTRVGLSLADPWAVTPSGNSLTTGRTGTVTEDLSGAQFVLT